MLKLIEKVKNAMEASEAAEAMNELMGHDRAKQGSMKECLSALLKAAGVNHAAEVYRAREGRIGGRRVTASHSCQTAADTGALWTE